MGPAVVPSVPTPPISLFLSSSPAARTQLIAAAQRCRGVLRTTLLAVAAANTQQSWGIAFPFRVELRSRSWTRDIDRDILGFGGGGYCSHFRPPWRGRIHGPSAFEF